MTCRHVLDLIDAGPLVTSPRAHLDAAREHAHECPACGPALTRMRELETHLAALEEPLPAPDFTAAVLSRIARVPAIETALVKRESPAAGWQRWPDWTGALGGAAAVAAIQWTASSAVTTLAPRTGTFAAGLVAMPPAEPAVAVLVLGLLVYAKGLFSVTATASPARRGAAGDTGSAPR